MNGRPAPSLLPVEITPALRRYAVWPRVLKTAALFLLPLPLIFAILAAAIAGDVQRLGLTAGALACLWTAGTLTGRSLVAEARWTLGDRIDLPRIPWKLVSLALTGVGSALAALAGGHSLTSASPFAAFSVLGYLAFYGRDLRPPRLDVPVVTGVDVSAVRQQLEQAHQRLRRIDAARRSIQVPELAQRLSRIVDVGRRILDQIQEDPRDAARVRRFLHLYLDSTERVTEEYARTHRQVRDAALEQNFQRLLVDIEHTFAEQHRKLLETDVVSLDVEIEVLNARLQREGLSDHARTRS